MFIYIWFLPHSGMSLYPFILLKKKTYLQDIVLINHERIHLKQQSELLILPFYVFYFLNYLINIVRFRNHQKAYREIIFEKEAYANEKNMDYLKNRKLWAFL